MFSINSFIAYYKDPFVILSNAHIIVNEKDCVALLSMCMYLGGCASDASFAGPARTSIYNNIMPLMNNH